MRKVWFLILISFVFSACSKDNKIDRQKFERLYRAARAVETFSVPDETSQLRNYVKDLKIESSVAVPSSQAENNMIFDFELASSYFSIALVQYEGAVRSGDVKQYSAASGKWMDGLTLVRRACAWYLEGEIRSSSTAATHVVNP